jgi:hypothetical protein
LSNLARRLGWQLLANLIAAAIVFRLLNRFIVGNDRRRERKLARIKPKRYA